MKLLFTSPHGFREHARSFTDFVLARALLRRGHTVVAYTERWGGDPDEEIIEGVRIRRVRDLNARPSFTIASDHWRMWKTVRKLIRHDRPDIINLFHLRSQCNYPVTRVAHWLRIPVILFEWGILHDDYLVLDRDRPLAGRIRYDNVAKNWGSFLEARRYRSHAGVGSLMRNYLLHYPLFRADRIVFLSGHNVPHAIRLGVNPEKLRVFRTVIELENSHDTISEVLPELEGVPRPWVLFIGQLKYRKGFDIAVHAMREVVKDYPQASLLFVSSTDASSPNYSALKALVTESGLENNYCFLGRLANKAVRDLMRRSDVFVFPSRYEGFGIPLLEAMEARCPIVATDVVAINETIRDRTNGLLFPLEDVGKCAECVKRLLADRNLREHIVESSSQFVREYDVERHVQELELIYEELRDTNKGHLAS